MRKEKIITLVISIVLIGLTRVNAATVNQWADNLPVLSRIQMYECGANQCYEKTTDFGGISTGGDGDRKYIFSSNNLITFLSGFFS